MTDAAARSGSAWEDAPARAVVTVAALYVVALFALRLALSDNLEIDEAQFVGAVDLRLVYGNSHPPLYNWLVRGALELTGWRWALAVALVKAALILATHALLFDAARRLAGTSVGILTLAVAALLPQVVWMSVHTLAHSVLVMAGAAGVVWGLVAVARTGAAWAFAALGLAAAVAVLGKFNALLLLAPLALAVALEPGLRRRFATARSLLGAGVFAALAGPVLVAASQRPEASTSRMEKLYEGGRFAALDVAGVGLDGLLSLVLAVLAWGGIALALLALAPRSLPTGATEAMVRRTLWRAVGLGLAGFALFVLAGDVRVVHERYLTPLLMPLPVLAALHLRGWRYRGWLVGTAAVAYAAVPLGVTAMVAFDDHRWAQPYDALAAALTEELPGGAVAVGSPQQDVAANMALALQRQGVPAHLESETVHERAPTLVWLQQGLDDPPEGGWPRRHGRCPATTLHLTAPLGNLAGRLSELTAVIHRADRCARR